MLLALPAAAQDAPRHDHGKWGLLAGAGAFATPKYSGDDNYRVLALPFLRGSYGDNFYVSVPEGANYDIYKKDGLRIKAKAGIAFPLNSKALAILIYRSSLAGLWITTLARSPCPLACAKV